MRCDCVITIQFTYRQRSMINEKTTIREIVISNKNILKIKIDFTNINLSQQNQKMKVNKKCHAFFEIFENVNTIKKTSRHVSHIYKN